MTDASPTHPPSSDAADLTASVVVAAPPEVVWDTLSDVTRMGEWSPETFRCRWLGGERGPVVGARFVGFNKRGWARWLTTNVVVEAERGRAFAFRTRENGAQWSFRLEPEGDGTRLTESRRLTKGKTRFTKLLSVFIGGHVRHDRELAQGMQQTVERIKAAAEATGPT